MTVQRPLSVLFATLALTSWAGVCTAADAVPPAAQAAFERGVIAAEQQHWLVALRYFSEAQKKAPAAAPILFNLGLAHAKAGQELAAIAWLQAYLAAAPQAPNAAAVRTEILRLDVATEAKIARIVQEAEVAAAVADKGLTDIEVGTARAFEAAAGDVEGAIKRGVKADRAWSMFAEELSSAGLVEKAEEANQRVSDPTTRDRVYSEMVKGVLNRSTPWTPTSRREFDLARAFASRIHDPGRRAEFLVLVLTRDFRTTDIPLAETTLTEVRSAGALSLPEKDRGALLIAMIKAAVATKDVEAARSSAERLLKLKAWGMPAQTPNPVFDAVTMIPAAQLAQGDVKGARATATTLAPLTTGPLRAALDAVLGAYDPARGFARTLACTDDGRESRRRTVEWLIFVHVATGEIAAAKTTARATFPCEASTTTNRHDYPQAVVDALLRKGDLRGAVAAAKEMAGGASSRELSALARRAPGRDELTAIEQAVADLIKDESDRMYVHLALAEAYAARDAGSDANRLRVQAARFLLGSAWYARDVPSQAIVLMARALEQSGDAAAARAASALAVESRGLVEEWSNNAQSLSSNELVVELAATLKTAVQGKSSSKAAQEVAFVAVRLARELFKLRAVALRTAEP